MKITNILLASLSALFLATPVAAKMDSHTKELLETVNNSGITVAVNSADCKGQHGSYQFLGMKRTLILCPGETIEATDHDTVRHEVFHAIQHCVNVARGTPLNTPFNNDYDDLSKDIRKYLPVGLIQAIQESYPKEMWWVEWEAYMVADNVSAAQLEQLFLKVCVAD